MDKFLFGLSVALIGMLVVFVGLIILIGSIRLISIFSGTIGARKKTKPEDEVVNDFFTPIMTDGSACIVPDNTTGEISPEILMAITIAIMSVWDNGSDFVVRRVRRVGYAPAWNRAGREDQIYSRM